MPQPPKFILTEDSEGNWTWSCEAANATITAVGTESRPSPEFCIEDIETHMETAVAASGVSLSLGVDWQPIVEERPYQVPHEEDEGQEPEEESED